MYKYFRQIRIKNISKFWPNHMQNNSWKSAAIEIPNEDGSAPITYTGRKWQNTQIGSDTKQYFPTITRRLNMHKRTYHYVIRTWETKSVLPHIKDNRNPNLHLWGRKPNSAPFTLWLQTGKEGENADKRHSKKEWSEIAQKQKSACKKYFNKL